MARNRNVVFLPMLTGMLFGMLFTALPASAQSAHHKHHHRHTRSHTHAVYVRPQPASLVVDVDTGKILESENADQPRYPASLTKMMTLYLTFEALKNGQLTFNTMIPVSAHAAGQPQTNISLQPGDRIAVKDAILSIVVRSANDSAVTLGEALGDGSEETFAEKMTRKAHALGMSHTFFYNASGLPNPSQHTTARDMATLGLALRKHFPQYFPLFKTESFNYRGLTYVTHNHVMMRYEGVDGIKTGFIRASGYNLVTSANRDNHHLIGVVLGGSTIRSRDDRMIALLDKNFADLETLPGANRVQYATNSVTTGRRIPAFPSKIEKIEESMEGEGDRPGDDVITTAALRKPLPSSAANNSGPSSDAGDADAPKHTADIVSTAHGWGIQVGAYAQLEDAQNAANHAIEQVPEDLTGSTVAVSDDGSPKAAHRARLVNLTQEQAEEACQKLTAAHGSCFVYRVD